MFYAVTFFTVLILCFIFWDVKKPKKFPPGPRWYPLVGSALQVSQMRLKHGMFCKVIEELHKIYLNPYGIFGLKIGKDKLVIAYSHESVKEMMTNEDLDGRPDGIFYRSRTFGTRKGIMLTDEEFWMEQRRFIVRHLKEFGFARRGMAHMIQNEAQHLLDDLKSTVQKHGGHAAIVPMQGFFPVFVLNTLWTMMAGIRYDRDNVEVIELLNMFNELFKSIDMVGCLFSHFPFLRYVAPDFSGYSNFVENHYRFYEFLHKEVENHKRSYMPNSEPKDLIDSYLQVLSTPDHKMSFSEEQLLAVCLDMFLAGSETTHKSLGFGFLHMVRDPSIQKRAQDELDAVVGRERQPTWEDRPNLPYCESIVHEALRFFVGHTFGIPHRALVDTRLGGFYIPKDTMVVACFRGMAMNPKTFPNPTKFMPERFLDVDGHFAVPDGFSPFGVGRHRCMGEIMAKQNLFLFTTTLLQNFSFLPLDGHLFPDSEPFDGATASVKPYSAKVVPR